MGEYAPAALRWLAAEICKAIPGARLSGIIGDRSHTYGYHRARSHLPASDYSVQLKPDRQGDADAASAVDISLPAAQMRTVTHRLLASAKDKSDPRLNSVREFFGTLDGKHVTGWDCYHYRPATSDTSHLWHVHLSVLRKYATNRDALAPVLSVIKGETLMSLTARDFWRYDPGEYGKNGITNPAWRHDAKTNKTVTPGYWAYALWDEGHDTNTRLRALADQVTALSTRIDAIPATLAPAIVTAVGDALADGIPADALARAVEDAVRKVLGSLDNKPTL